MPELPSNFEESSKFFEDAPRNFFQEEKQEQLRRLARYVNSDHFRPIFVTGPAGFGKSALVRYYLARYRPPRTEVEWVYLDRSPDPVQAVEVVLNRMRATRTENRLLVVLDGADGILPKQLDDALNRIFNWKAVSNVIVITRQTEIKTRRGREIKVGPPAGKLYGLKEQTAQKKIIQLVAPQIITTNDPQECSSLHHVLLSPRSSFRSGTSSSCPSKTTATSSLGYCNTKDCSDLVLNEEHHHIR